MTFVQKQQSRWIDFFGSGRGDWTAGGIFRWQSQKEPIIKQSMVCQRLVARWQSDNGAIQVARTNLFQQTRRQSFCDRNSDTSGRRLFQECRDKIGGKGRDQAQSQRGVICGGDGFDLGRAIQHRLRPGCNRPTQWGQCKATWGPVDQIGPDQCFQFPDLCRHRGLGDRDTFGGPTKMALSRKRVEVKQLSESDFHCASFIRKTYGTDRKKQLPLMKVAL